jgi:hypothetical protein
MNICSNYYYTFLIFIFCKIYGKVAGFSKSQKTYNEITKIFALTLIVTL